MPLGFVSAAPSSPGMPLGFVSLAWLPACLPAWLPADAVANTSECGGSSQVVSPVAGFQ